MPLTYFLAELIGLYCIVIGAVMLFRKQVFVAVIDGYYHNQETIFLPGILATFLGLMLVLSHNYWGVGTLALVVTVIGWAALVKGLSAPLFSSSATSIIKMLKVKEFAWVYGIVIIVIGAYLALRRIYRLGCMGRKVHNTLMPGVCMDTGYPLLPASCIRIQYSTN